MENYIGTTLKSRYKIEKELGRGVLGTTYVAKDTIRNQDICLKLLHPTFAKNKELNKSLFTIIGGVLDISHPSLAKIYDIDTDGDLVFIVSEYFSGGNLKSRQWEEYDNRPILLSALEGLKKLESLNIVYGDIKPENILFTESGDLKLTDFYIHSIFKDSNVDANRLSPYSSPEETDGKPLSTASDLFSLGEVFLEKIWTLTPELNAPYLDVLKNSISMENRYLDVDSFIKAIETPVAKNIEIIEETVPVKETVVSRKVDESYKKDIHKLKRILTLIGILAVFLILVMPIILNVTKGREIETPNLVDMNIDTARMLLSSADLKVEVLKEIDGKKTPGTIISQDPIPGTIIKKGRTIYVNISTGAKMIMIPNIVGMNLQTAIKLLKDQGFNGIKINRIFNDKVQKDSVISQKPAAGMNVTAAEMITIDVSRGNSVAVENEVPDLTGKSKTDAQTILAALNLTLKVDGEQYSDDCPEGTIVSQNPEAGQTISQSSVSVILSKGKHPIEEPQTEPQEEEPTEQYEQSVSGSVEAPTVKVPNITGLSLSELKAVLAKNNLVLGEVKYRSQDGATPDEVIEQFPLPGLEIQTGTAINIVVAAPNGGQK